jgi:hypothetical protein
MAGIFRAIRDEINSRVNQNDTLPVNTYEGFAGAVVLRDRSWRSKIQN